MMSLGYSVMLTTWPPTALMPKRRPTRRRSMKSSSVSRANDRPSPRESVAPKFAASDARRRFRFIQHSTRLADAHLLPQFINHRTGSDADILPHIKALGVETEKQNLIEPRLDLDDFGIGVAPVAVRAAAMTLTSAQSSSADV